MGFEDPAKEVPVKTPEQIMREQEYEKGKKVQLPDGQIVTVHSLEEEIAKQQEAREK